MTTLLNIDGSTTMGYRYKMPPIESKVEGRGNGIKTVIPNADAVARALKVDGAYVVKWLGMELGAQSTWNDETKHAVVNGSHSAPVLQETLQGFINTFVLCPRCKLPEIVMSTAKKDLMIDCKACGEHSKSASKHKIISFIKRTLADSAEKEATLVLDEELEAKIDRANVAQPSSRIRTEEEFLDDNIEKIRSFLVAGSPTPDDVMEHLRLIAVAAEYDENQRLKLLFYSLMTTSGNDPYESVRNNIELIKHAFPSNTKSMILFLKYLALFFSIFSSIRNAHISRIVSYLYNVEYLDEDVIYAWHSTQNDKIKESLKPVIEWLEEDVSEGSESGSDQSDGEESA
ncbi:hypothetical protein RCL1_006773 [Eukaryota sp. TZLM3-RCL]